MHPRIRKVADYTKVDQKEILDTPALCRVKKVYLFSGDCIIGVVLQLCKIYFFAQSSSKIVTSPIKPFDG